MVRKQYDTVIIGGGPAGAAAGLALARQGLSAVIVEKQEDVPDKICGEFFSPECVSYFSELGMRPDFFRHDPSPINHVHVSFNGSRIHTMIDTPAYGLSRKKIDTSLLDVAAQNGIELLRGYEAIRHTQTNGRTNIVVKNRQTEEYRTLSSKYLIGATGAKSGSESMFAETRRRNTKGSFTVAFKFHAVCPPVSNAIELYFTPMGYVGIGSIEGGMVNVCGLVDSDLIKSQYGDIRGVLGEISKESIPFRERCDTMNNISDVITCSNLSFGRRTPIYNDVLCIGDTAGSIHPFCGDGNAMALKSGLLSAEAVERAMRLNWDSRRLTRQFNELWRKEFTSRIMISGLVYYIITHKVTRPAASVLSGIYPGIINKIFNLTRDSKP